MSINSRFDYLISVPGLLRLLNLLLGVFSGILAFIGFTDDFQGKDDIGTPYVTYYGLGYKAERANQWNLAAICICLTTSATFLLARLTTKISDSENKLKALNRFLNLSLAIILLLGWISGLIGFLLFRQGCCRVEILSLERIKYENDGYHEACLCLVNPHNDPEVSYPVLLYQDAPIGMSFERADPHHFYGHVASLVLTFLNVLIYIGAFIKVE